jgi:hypothetical protein
MRRNTVLVIGTIVLIVLSLAGFGIFRKSGVTQNTVLSSPAPQTPTGKSVSYNCEHGKTAFELLESSHQTETKDTSFGKMVMGIDNVKSEENKDFWAFYVDDKQATIGAQLYNCMDQEKIEWKLEKIL